MKKSFLLYTALLCLLGLQLSCGGKQKYNKIAYKEWLQSHGEELQVEKSIGDYRFVMQYQPTDMMLLREMKEDCSPADLNKMRAEKSVLQYYVLQVGAANGSNNVLRTNIQSEGDYYARLEYYNTFAQNDIYLVEGKDTIACALYHYERYYNAAPYDKMVLAFENSNYSGDKLLVYDDQVLGVGTVKLNISSDLQDNIPELVVEE